MIEKAATVIAIEGKLAVLNVTKQSSCGTCAAKSGCGTSVLSEVFGRESVLRAYNQIGAKCGDSVTVAIPEAIMLKVSFMMYMLPLLAMLGFAILGQTLFANELISIVAGVLGFVFGLIAFRLYGLRTGQDTDNLPILIKQFTPINVTIASAE